MWIRRRSKMEKLGNKKIQKFTNRKMKEFSFSFAMQFDSPDFFISKWLNFA